MNKPNLTLSLNTDLFDIKARPNMGKKSNFTSRKTRLLFYSEASHMECEMLTIYNQRNDNLLGGTIIRRNTESSS